MVTGPTAQVSLCALFRFLSETLRRQIVDPKTNEIKLFKNVFSTQPDVGSTLAFIGFVQPASGGIITMSETQARWFVQVCKGKCRLPSQPSMEATIASEQAYVARRYAASKRHTIQRDPLTYNDDLAARFGAKPSFWQHPLLAFRLLFSSSGAAQWRLQGPGRWAGAARQVRKVPITKFWQVSLVLAAIIGGRPLLRALRWLLALIWRAYFRRRQ